MNYLTGAEIVVAEHAGRTELVPGYRPATDVRLFLKHSPDSTLRTFIRTLCPDSPTEKPPGQQSCQKALKSGTAIASRRSQRAPFFHRKVGMFAA